MINSAKELEVIGEHIAVLRMVIAQCGKQGKFNINKSCEGMVMRMLNLAYGYRLKNLGEESVTFPGIDLGDRGNIAFQVTSEKTSEKIDETLAMVLKHEHHILFPTIKIFILSNKQGSYTITTNTSPHFIFSKTDDILDFDDLLNKIEHCEPKVISAIHSLVQTELPLAIDRLKGTEADQPEPLVNIQQGIMVSKMKHYRYANFEIKLGGSKYSAPAIYKLLKQKLINHSTNRYLPIFYPANLQTSNSQLIEYRIPLAAAGASNNYKEQVLKITANQINFGYAQYVDNSTLITNLDEEVGGLITILLIIQGLYVHDPLKLDIKIQLTTDADLYFTPQQSLYNVGHVMSTYQLNPNRHEVEFGLYNLENEKLIDMMQEIINGFATEKPAFGSHEPFLAIDEQEQKTALNALRNIIHPSEF